MDTTAFDMYMKILRKELPVGESFDLLERKLIIGGRRASMFFVDGLTDGEKTQRILAYLMAVPAASLCGVSSSHRFIETALPFLDTTIIEPKDSAAGNPERTRQPAADPDRCDVGGRRGATEAGAGDAPAPGAGEDRTAPGAAAGQESDTIALTPQQASDCYRQMLPKLYAGLVPLLVEGLDRIIIIDCRDYPTRSVEEPEKEKTLRGAKDGFTENFMENVALIRRRIRDNNLIFKAYNVGSVSKSDVAIVYLKDKADMKLIEKLDKCLKDMSPDADNEDISGRGGANPQGFGTEFAPDRASSGTEFAAFRAGSHGTEFANRSQTDNTNADFAPPRNDSYGTEFAAFRAGSHGTEFAPDRASSGTEFAAFRNSTHGTEFADRSQVDNTNVDFAPPRNDSYGTEFASDRASSGTEFAAFHTSTHGTEFANRSQVDNTNAEFVSDHTDSHGTDFAPPRNDSYGTEFAPYEKLTYSAAAQSSSGADYLPKSGDSAQSQGNDFSDIRRSAKRSARSRHRDDSSVLSVADQSLLERLLAALGAANGLNPFPKVRYSQRPDVIAAHLAEGKAAIIVDNSPTVMLLPVSVFEFFQDVDDYYFPRLTGNYFRFIRIINFLVILFLTPVYLILAEYDNFTPEVLKFFVPDEDFAIPVFWQFILLEIAVDGLKLASLNTPTSLGMSLSVIGALILGEFSIESGWFISQTILCMAVVALAAFTQPSIELSYAMKFGRILLLIGAQLFGIAGTAAATVIFFVIMAATNTLSGDSYLYPLIPFNGTALKRLIFRTQK